MNEDKKEEKQDTSVATLEEATMPPKQPNQIPEESGGADGDVTTKTEESTNSSFPQTPPAEPKSIPVTQSPSTGKKKAGLKVSIISPKSSDPGEALYPESAIITALEENKATSAPTERIFSKASLLITQKRAMMSPDIASTMLFVKSNRRWFEKEQNKAAGN